MLIRQFFLWLLALDWLSSLCSLRNLPSYLWKSNHLVETLEEKASLQRQCLCLHTCRILHPALELVWDKIWIFNMHVNTVGVCLGRGFKYSFTTTTSPSLFLIFYIWGFVVEKCSNCLSWLNHVLLCSSLTAVCSSLPFWSGKPKMSLNEMSLPFCLLKILRLILATTNQNTTLVFNVRSLNLWPNVG